MRKSLLLKMFITISSVMLLLTNPLIVKATTIFSNFGQPGNTYDATQGAGIFGYPDPNQNIAASFVPGSDYLFDSADLALLMYPEIPGYFTSNTLDVWLMSDSGGLPGTIMASFSVSIPFNSSGIYTVSSASHPLLTSGATYWVAVSPDGSARAAWLANNQGLMGLAVGHFGPPFGLNDSQLTPAFRVEGTPVPEPGILILLGISMISVAGLKRWWKE